MHTITVRTLAALTLTAAGACAHAADLNAIGSLNQAQFRALSEDLGAAVSYKPMVPAAGLGVLGFDVGVSAQATSIKSLAALKAAAGGASVPSQLPMVSLRAVKGLPFDVDVGAALGTVPGSNVRTVGGEFRWAFIGGNLVLPAVAVRGTINRLSGVDKLKVNTSSLDLSISKGFALVTPYAGVGTVRVKSEAPGVATLAGESFTKGKVFGGLNVNLGLMNLAFETDKTGDNTSYGIKAGLRF